LQAHRPQQWAEIRTPRWASSIGYACRGMPQARTRRHAGDSTAATAARCPMTRRPPS